MRFITLNNQRISIDNIKKYYSDTPSIYIQGVKYVAIEYIDGTTDFFQNITVEEIDKLIGVNKPKPRPRG